MRSVQRRTAWIVGAGVLAIALAADDPPSRDEESGRPSTSNSAVGVSTFPVPGESPTRQSAMEPELEYVESPEYSPAFNRKIEARMAEAAKSIKPNPPFVIPDDPPPHEGAMIDYPLIIDAPDLIQVEVLEALPGRPISGERLVRPDGTICLEFYGDVHVRGLTPKQAKARIIVHLRQFMTDEVLGLVQESFTDFSEPVLVPSPVEPSDEAITPPAGEVVRPELVPELEGVDLDTLTPEMRKAIRDLLRTREQKQADPDKSTRNDRRRTIHRAARETPAAIPAELSDVPPAVVVPTQTGNVKITIEVQGEANVPVTADVPVLPQPDAEPGESIEENLRVIHPFESDRVFVAVTAFNHDVYYVQGGVTAPGRLPCTGNETVLDALNYAGGLENSADPANIKLVRPGKGGKPSKIYRINYNAIVNEGDAVSNLQLFPGDRLIVGWKPKETAKASK